jgi:glycine/D-amino acid oxidase-like deaminating enzyme
VVRADGIADDRTADAVVVGAGVVGAACAYYLALAGVAAVVVERAGVAGGTTGAGEGNILVSDKLPGPELALALLSNRLWREAGVELGPDIELEPKGGLVVSADEPTQGALLDLAAEQRFAGVETESLAADRLRDLEPRIATDLAGGVLYPQDMQVQPMLAAARMLRLARERGARLLTGAEVIGIETAGDAVSAVRTSRGVIATRVVVNAAGTWGAEVAAFAGVEMPVLPRRGFILVTEPLPPLIRHKVYTAEYVANVASGEAGLEMSTVVEGTASGTILIGASRERVGFDRALSVQVLSELARGATRLFPFLRGVRAIRSYLGFRPYCPDHLPVIGPDPRVAGLFHACGHEGAGVGLAQATGRLVADGVVGRSSEVSLEPFSPGRFEVAHA